MRVPACDGTGRLPDGLHPGQHLLQCGEESTHRFRRSAIRTPPNEHVRTHQERTALFHPGHRKSKNSSDGTLIMDAMELMYRGPSDGFCIVSSDCDFTGLAGRIVEKGLLVYGLGHETTMRAFVAACDEFFYVGETQDR